MVLVKKKRIRRFIVLLVSLLLSTVLLLPAYVFADEAASTGNALTGEPTKKTVRVGWHEEPYFITGPDGRRSGYSYEYQWKVAAYTDWDYEYVEGNWSELLQMLKDGEIDLLSDVSYTPERAKEMLYASLPMGTEAYYIFVSPDNTDITQDDYTSLNGKTVGVTQDTIQKDYFLKWEEMHGIETELVELTGSEEDSLKLLGTQLDAFVTMDVFGDPDIAIPICKIGSSEFYFAVNKDRPDLLIELDTAMNRIQDENKFFNQELHEKYLSSSNTDRYLNTQEKNWLSSHGTIRVGYQDNYLAFCASDENGDLIGALKDYLAYATTALENATLNFEAISYPTTSDAVEALKNGEVDCVFPANLTVYDSETLGLVMTPPLMHTEMDAVVRASEQREFIRNPQVVVAVNQGNTNYDLFLAEHYPNWKRVYFEDTPAGLEAVAAKEADCVIISNYRYSNISKQCEKLQLSTVYTGVDMDYCFAVPKGETELYSILSRVIGSVPDATIHAALTYYSTEDVKTSFGDLIKDNLLIVLIVIALVLLVILLLLLRSIHAEKKIREEEHLVKDLNKRVFVDSLTHVRNKGAYSDYIQALQDKIDQNEALEFAIGVFDCNDLKKVNDENGHDKGDLYLQTASRLICRVFQHSPVFRIGGDEFVVLLQNEDFQNREELVDQFEKERKEICASAENSWDEVHIAMGIAVYDSQTDRNVADTARRADKIMYENKRKGKTSAKGGHR